ncbi:hypothetical protein Y032_0026g1415 [Ancylostoma ceylanicum]|uniref:Uncharacterized protein n=1 Tax=Ancylostoma ceylanicum TaxID=53326 RepID=A0A016UVP2_9BILA|nr:hypothetical protein Y032_0026g1415 [Ancylostoma ceylanicum]
MVKRSQSGVLLIGSGSFAEAASQPQSTALAKRANCADSLVFSRPDTFCHSFNEFGRETKVKTSQNTRDARQNVSKPMDYRNETVLLRWC